MAASVTLRPLYYPKAIQEQQTQGQNNTGGLVKQEVFGGVLWHTTGDQSRMWLVLEVEDDFQNLIGQRAGVHVVHVGEHNDSGVARRDEGKGRTCSLLAAGMSHNVNAKLV